MTKEEFDKETFNYPKQGEAGFQSGGFYGKEFEDIDHRVVHIKRCFGDFEDSNPLVKLWFKAKDLKDFYSLIKKDKYARMTQFVGELLRDDKDFVESLIENAERFYTSSDAGGVKIGNDSFSVIIPNGYGDTDKNIVAVIDDNSLNKTAFDFWSVVEGTNISIYEYDCGNDTVATLSGEYGVYVNDRVIVFEKWV